MPKRELSQLRKLLTPRTTDYIPHRPEPPQAAFLLLTCLEAFYGGAAGGGKSDALLMAALQYVDVPEYAALLLRRTFPELSQPGSLMHKAHLWLSPWKDHGVTWHEQKKRWTFPSGATLTFGYLGNLRDVYQYQSAEFQFVGFDELTQFGEEPYRYLFSRLRRPEEGPLSRVPLRMRSASNPGNVGHGWVKKRFVEPVDRQGRIYIPAKLSDNPHVDAKSYIEGLQELPDVTRQQLMEGDWGAFEGAAYPMFDRALHSVQAFTIPDSFQRWEAMDHGVTNPTSWLLICQDYDGNRVVVDEYYAPGLPDVHAAEVLARRKDWWEAKNEQGWQVRHTAYGDPASLRESLPLRDDFGQPKTLQDIYQELGLRLVPANNRRRTGFIEIASSLKPDPARMFPLWHPRAGETGAPSLFVVTAACPALTEQLENAPLASEEADPERGEAVDRRWESAYGHAHASLRYGLLGRALTSSEPEPEPEDPRMAVALRLRKRLQEMGSQKDLVDL